MEKHIPQELDDIIHKRCQLYKSREEERKEAIEKLNKSTDMSKVEKWRKIEEHQHREYDQDDVDLGFV